MNKRIVLLMPFLLVLIGFITFHQIDPGHASPNITFVVNSTADAVDDSLGDGACHTATGMCTLRAAIQEANTSAVTETITLPAGTYLLTRTGNGEEACATGDLDITQDLVINGAGAASTIIDGNGSTLNDRVIEIRYSDPKLIVSISNVTIRNGNIPTLQGGGGGIVNSGHLTLEGVVLTSNRVNGTDTDDIGGAISPSGYAGTILHISHSTIEHNSANRGGGIFVNLSMTMWITDTLVYSNTAVSGAGISNFGNASLTNVTISGNDASPGISGVGGLSNSGTVNFLNSTLAYNLGPGGAISNNGTFNLAQSIIASNTSYNCNPITPFTSLGHNLDDDDSCGLSGSHDITNTLASLLPLANNGGPTWTHALPANSPAVDWVDSGLWPITDQRGFRRPLDGNGDGSIFCDIGAFERGLSVYLPLVRR